MPKPPRVAMRILIRLPVCSSSRDFIALNCGPINMVQYKFSGRICNHWYECVDHYESTLSKCNKICPRNQVTAVIAGRSCPQWPFTLMKSPFGGFLPAGNRFALSRLLLNRRSYLSQFSLKSILRTTTTMLRHLLMRVGTEHASQDRLSNRICNIRKLNPARRAINKYSPTAE